MTIKKFINLALIQEVIDVRNSENLHNFLNQIKGKRILDQDDLRLKLVKIIDCYKKKYCNPFTNLANEFDYSVNQILGCRNGTYNFGFKLAEKVEKKYEELKNEGLI